MPTKLYNLTAYDIQMGYSYDRECAEPRTNDRFTLLPHKPDSLSENVQAIHIIEIRPKPLDKTCNPPPTNANAVQIGGNHYKSKPIQPWDFIVANNMGFLDGNVVKYVTRFRDKDGLKDLEKAKHYLEKLIEVTR